VLTHRGRGRAGVNTHQQRPATASGASSRTSKRSSAWPTGLVACIPGSSGASMKSES
jgi:hypothetical protein